MKYELVFPSMKYERCVWERPNVKYLQTPLLRRLR